VDRDLDEARGAEDRRVDLHAREAGTQVLQVVSSIRILINDKVQVMLDTGVLFSTTILSVPSATSIQLAAKLPYKVSSGALVEDTTAYAQPNIG